MGSGFELYAVKLQQERQWAYARRLEHLDYRQMRERAKRSPAEGGLGYDVSEHSLRKLVDGYLEDQREVLAINRDELRERELNDLDLVQRLALQAMQVAAADGRMDATAAKVMLEAGVQRRKLLGLDAPAQAHLDVTVTDAATVELEAMLAEAGLGPLDR